MPSLEPPFWFFLLIANTLHGLVAWIWIIGVRRFSRPVPAPWIADFFFLALTLPVAAGFAKFVGVPFFPDSFRILRTDLWSQWLWNSGWTAWLGCTLLFAGTFIIFISQELLPVWRTNFSALPTPTRQDERLSRAISETMEAFREHNIQYGKTLRLDGLCLETEERAAILHGLFRPKLIVSRGLLEALDESELRGVIAHELAHLVYGGNLGMVLLWGIRSLQALSPFALILFRELTDTQEVACDELASKVTGKPGALAAALLKAGTASSDHTMTENLGLRRRVRALLDLESTVLNEPPRLSWLVALSLGGMLWLVF